MARPERPVLPARDGVGASCVALPPGPWPTVAAFLSDRFPAVGAATWRDRMVRGLVLDDAGEPIAADAPYRPQAQVHYYRDVPDERSVPFEAVVRFADAHLVVVDKPHFLPVTPGGGYLQETVLVRMRRRLGIDTLAPVHRLDRETAGVVMLAVHPGERAAYHALFRARAVEKVYEAVAPWRPDLPLPLVRRSRLAPSPNGFLQMAEVDGEPNAETAVECLGPCGGGLARYRLRPRTGQRHQLRVHLAALGRPIVGDRIYPRLAPHDPAATDRPLQLLARSLAFDDPVTGEPRRFESRLALSAWNFGHDARTDKEDPREV